MTLVVVVVLTSLFATLLFDRCPLLDAGIVALEFNASIGWEVEDMLHGFTVLPISYHCNNVLVHAEQLTES